MTGWTAFVIADFLLAAAVAFVSGWLWGRQRGHAAGFKAGLAWGGRRAVYLPDREPTSATVAESLR